MVFARKLVNAHDLWQYVGQSSDPIARGASREGLALKVIAVFSHDRMYSSYSGRDLRMAFEEFHGVHDAPTRSLRKYQAEVVVHHVADKCFKACAHLGDA